MANKSKLAALEGVPFKEYIYMSLFGVLATFLTYILLSGFLPPVVPFLYGSPSGERQIISQVGLLLVPGLSLITIFLNLFVAYKTSDKFVKQALVFGSFLFTLLMVITFVKVVMLVGFF